MSAFARCTTTTTIGHVVPSARSHSDYRLYTDADVERLHRVLVYREVGLSLEQIATLLDDPDRDELSTLEEQRRLLNERIDRLHRMVDALEELMANKNNGITLTAAEQAGSSATTGPARSGTPRRRSGGATPTPGRRAGNVPPRCRRPTCRRSGRAGRVDGRLGGGEDQRHQPGSTEANALAQRHRASITRFHDCDDEMHEPRPDVSRRRAVHRDLRRPRPGLAQWVHDIIVANASPR